METQEPLQDRPVEIEAERAAPLSKVNKTLLVKFAEDVAAQATRLDDLAKQVITLCIAVPGIYAAVLKLVAGKDGLMPQGGWTLSAFLAWMFALGLSLAALLPRERKIDTESLTGIRNYFSESAGRKHAFLCVACLANFIGIALAVYSIFKM